MVVALLIKTFGFLCSVGSLKGFHRVHMYRVDEVWVFVSSEVLLVPYDVIGDVLWAGSLVYPGIHLLDLGQEFRYHSSDRSHDGREFVAGSFGWFRVCDSEGGGMGRLVVQG